MWTVSPPLQEYELRIYPTDIALVFVPRLKTDGTCISSPVHSTITIHFPRNLFVRFSYLKKIRIDKGK